MLKGADRFGVLRVAISFDATEFEVRSGTKDYLVFGSTDGRPTASAGELAGYEPQKICGSDWYAVGGLLPDAAVRAEVLTPRGAIVPAVAGNGGYVAVVSEPLRTPATPAVRFADEGDELVSLPWPAGPWEMRDATPDEINGLPYRDEHGRCLICGGVALAVGRRADDAGYRIACARCGYCDGSLVHRVSTRR